MDHPNELNIVNRSRDLLVTDRRNYSGISVDLYQFCYNPPIGDNPPRASYQGHIFHANNMEDISFENGVEAFDVNHKRDAMFLIHEPYELKGVEKMLERSLSVRHEGILNPYVVGYNTQISKVVSAFRLSTESLGDWLAVKHRQAPSAHIPLEVREQIRTAYQAIVAIWHGNSSSGHLADVTSYRMVNNVIKIDPLRMRDRNPGENNMQLRTDFSQMIFHHIYTLWRDHELLDLVELLKNSNARDGDILGAPVLLSPDQRQLMYYSLNKSALALHRKNWMKANADLGVHWMTVARSKDQALKEIIDSQPQRGGKGFSLDWEGALHFATVVTAHYPQHFRNLELGKTGLNIQDRVDLLLKEVLPQLLSRRYYSQFVKAKEAAAAGAAAGAAVGAAAAAAAAAQPAQ